MRTSTALLQMSRWIWIIWISFSLVSSQRQFSITYWFSFYLRQIVQWSNCISFVPFYITSFHLLWSIVFYWLMAITVIFIFISRFLGFRFCTQQMIREKNGRKKANCTTQIICRCRADMLHTMVTNGNIRAHLSSLFALATIYKIGMKICKN